MSFKRQADTELNQDNVHEMDKEVSDKAKHDMWKKAPDDVLATRKILKVSDGFAKPKDSSTPSTGGGGGGGFAAYAKINPFAAMGPPMGFSSSSKTPAPSIATSGTGGNGSSKVVPEATSSPKTNPFGAPNPAHNPFMNFVGENKPNVDYWQKFKEPIKVSASDSVSSSDVKVTFVNPSSTTNKQGESTSVSSGGVSNAATTGSCNEKSDTASKSVLESSNITKDDEGEGEEKDEDKSVDDTSSSSVISEKKPAKDTAAMFCKPTELDNGEAGEECVLKLRAKLYRLSASKEWAEVGTGPVRLLTPSTSSEPSTSQAPEAPLYPRVVMRREHQAGGPGTKVILNALFRSHFSVTKMGERAARLTCVAVPPEVPKSFSPDDTSISADTKETEEVKPIAIPMTFLFKMQHSHEADQFIKHVDSFLEKSKADDKK